MNSVRGWHLLRTLLPTLVVSLVAMPLSRAFAHAQSPMPRETLLSMPVTCHGISATTLTIENGKPKSTLHKSSDEMRIVRHNRTLSVIVNGYNLPSDTEPEMRRLLQEPDIYRITSETKEGLSSILSDSSYPTVHTLVIDHSGTKALWTESTLWWMAPIGRPTSTTVLFTCSKIKGKAR